MLCVWFCCGAAPASSSRIVQEDRMPLLMRYPASLHSKDRFQALSLWNTQRSPRHSFGSSQMAIRKNTARNTNQSQGWKNAAHSPPATTASSEKDAAQLLKGSGEELISALLPALVR